MASAGRRLSGQESPRASIGSFEDLSGQQQPGVARAASRDNGRGVGHDRGADGRDHGARGRTFFDGVMSFGKGALNRLGLRTPSAHRREQQAGGAAAAGRGGASRVPRMDRSAVEQARHAAAEHATKVDVLRNVLGLTAHLSDEQRTAHSKALGFARIAESPAADPGKQAKAQSLAQEYGETSARLRGVIGTLRSIGGLDGMPGDAVAVVGELVNAIGATEAKLKSAKQKATEARKAGDEGNAANWTRLSGQFAADIQEYKGFLDTMAEFRADPATVSEISEPMRHILSLKREITETNKDIKVARADLATARASANGDAMDEAQLLIDLHVATRDEKRGELEIWQGGLADLIARKRAEPIEV